MLLQHYVKLFTTSIVDRFARPTDFSQQAYAAVKQSLPAITTCGMTGVLLLACFCGKITIN